MKKQISTIIFLLGISFVFLLLSPGCKKFTEINPPRNEIVSQTVFDSDASAVSAIRGVYSLMMTNTSFTNGRLEEYTGIASDELRGYSSRIEHQQFYQNAILPQNGDLFQAFWEEPYKYILNANSILEGLTSSSGMTSDGKKQIEGEAKFIRAFCHFYLAALFGDVPYVISSDYRINSKLTRTTYQQVLLKIEADLLDARNLLVDDFSFSNGERIQPNKGAATALLARVYLYLNDWEKAAMMATELINNTSTYSLLTELNDVFLANSEETIWQLQPVVPGTNSSQGPIFILLNAPGGPGRRVAMTPQLASAYEANDERKNKWTGTFTNANGSWSYIHKYKIRFNTVVTEYSMVLRLAEQYLIRAEARAQLDDLIGSKSDIDAIRMRAGLSATTAIDKANLLSAIEQERRIELSGEAGHRWLDLQRTNRADAVLGPLKPGWQPTDKLFPIPQSEILLNPNLTQNPGY